MPPSRLSHKPLGQVQVETKHPSYFLILDLNQLYNKSIHNGISDYQGHMWQALSRPIVLLTPSAFITTASSFHVLLQTKSKSDDIYGPSKQLPAKISVTIYKVEYASISVDPTFCNATIIRDV